MKITVNGMMEQLPQALDILQLIEYFKEGDKHLIVEHNGRFVYPQDYEHVRVEDGDRIEFINPNFGG